jgi:hypothetical protein
MNNIERRSKSFNVIILANLVAAIVIVLLSIDLQGGKLILYVCVAVLHILLAIGIGSRKRWAYVLMIIYGLFQAVGMSLWSLIGLLTLMGEPLTLEKSIFFGISAVVVPFLVWVIRFLIRTLKQEI